MHAAVEEVDLDPCDLYIDLGTLIVEGRVPGLTERGFGEGPHCPPPQGQNRHQCDPACLECQRYEQIQKHMLLLWKNGIPMSIEVFMYPNCCAAPTNLHNIDTVTVSEMPYILLEQWTVHMLPRRVSNAVISPRGLMQAVRSYLYFSQLCAWFSSTCGKSPQNVHYRLCVPGEAFSSKFSVQPEMHTFPVANIGRNASMKVTVKTHPRFEKIPVVPCPKHHSHNELLKNPKHKHSLKAEHLETLAEELLPCEDGAVGEYVCDGIVPTAVTLLPASRTSSPADIMLGESLLDPPNSLCMYPKRYQSPSRCGSPSLEVPEHLLFGKGASVKRDAEMQRLKQETRNRSRPQRRPVVERFLKKALGNDVATPDPVCKNISNSNDKVSSKYNDMLHFPSEDASLTHGFVNYLCLKDDLKTLPQAEMECVLSRLRNQCQRGKTGSEEKQDAYLLSSPKSYSLLHGHNLSSPRCSPYSKVNVKKLSPEEISDEYSPSEFQKSLCSPLVCNNLSYPSNQPLSGKKLNNQNSENPSVVEKIKQNLLKHNEKVSLPLDSNSNSVLSSTEKHRTMCVNFKKQQPSSQILNEFPNYEKFPIESVHTQKTVNIPVVRNTTTEKTLGTDGKRAYQSCETETPETVSQITSSNFNIERCLETSRTSNNELYSRPFVKLRTSNDNTLLYSLLNAVRAHATTEDGNGSSHLIPSAEEKAQFRRSLDSATSLVFHQKNGLPLTSSPAPIRKSGTCFDFDSSLTTVSAIKRALFEKEPEDEEPELDDSSHLSISAPASITASSLLGTFEESVLNGRLEPVSTVEGFTAEIGASGSFCPRHITLPVTVFFYTLQDTDKVTSPYLGHINLGKKEYYVPKKGTIQVTLFNPHRTVVKMYVVRYDLSDMPSNCQTFLRQRTLYMPTDASETEDEARKWLRYLIHLRFASSKSGRIYLHTDIRVIIFRKSDLDAATIHGQRPYELRSFTHGPNNPKFSPRKL